MFPPSAYNLMSLSLRLQVYYSMCLGFDVTTRQQEVNRILLTMVWWFHTPVGLFALCLFKACFCVAANSSFPLLTCSTAASIQALVPLTVCVARMQSRSRWSCTDLISLTSQPALQEQTHVCLHHTSSCLSSRPSTCSCKLMRVPGRTSHMKAGT